MVNNIKECETPVKAEKCWESSSEKANCKWNHWFTELFTKSRVVEHNNCAFSHGESWVNTKEKKCNWEHKWPKVSTWHCLNSSRVCNESKTNRGYLFSHGWVHTNQVTNCRENSETGKEGKTWVAKWNSETVRNHWWVTRLVRGVGNHYSKADTDGEEDLTTSIRPHSFWWEFFSNVDWFIILISLEVHAEAVVTVL